MKKCDWQLKWHCFTWLVFPFMVFPYVIKMYWVTTAIYFLRLILLRCYSQLAKIFTFFPQIFSVNVSLLKCLPSIATKKEFVKIVVPILHDLVLRVTKRDVLQDPLHVLLAPTFRQSPELKWLITLPKNILKQLLRLLTNAKYMTKPFTAFNYCENIRGRYMKHKEVQVLKIMILHN